MPRTKYSRKQKGTNESLHEHDVMLKTFDRRAQQCITKLQRDAQTDIKSFEAFVDVTISRLPPEVRQLVLGELFLLENDNQKENCNVVSTSKTLYVPQTTAKLRKTARSTAKRATAMSDDGYATEGGCSISSTSRTTAKSYVVGQLPTTTRRTRSSTRANGNRLTETIDRAAGLKTVTKSKNNLLNIPSLKTDAFKTPAAPKSANMYNLITPKIKPNTPLNVLRRPRHGEMVLSMQGSPLLVSTVVEEKIANINVPLANGNIMSLLPQEGLRISHIPPLDMETMHQLETLKNHIEKVISYK